MNNRPFRALLPFFSFYGSKWKIAGRYPAPLYCTIIESHGHRTLEFDNEFHYPPEDVRAILEIAESIKPPSV